MMTKNEVLDLLEKTAHDNALAYISKEGNIIVLTNDCYIENGEIVVDENGDPIERAYDSTLIDKFEAAIREQSIDWGMGEYEFYTPDSYLTFSLFIDSRSEHYYYAREWEPDTII